MIRAASLFFLILVFHQAAFTDSTDIFPLHLGNSYLYGFDRSSSSWSFGYVVSSRDSGVVSCSVTGSSQSTDSTITWTVHEQWGGIRWMSTSTGYDTMYAFSDSIISHLLEITQGSHELQCSSSVWNFPVMLPNGMSYPVFRYADSSSLTMAFQWGWCPCCLGSDFDSLFFSVDSGLVRRLNSSCEDYDESGSISTVTLKLLSSTIVSVSQPGTVPQYPILYQNYPNPFNPVTTITFSLPKASDLSLKIFNLLGEEVVTLVHGQKEAGPHTAKWDAGGQATGVYFYRLQAGDFVETRKLIVLR